MAVQLLLQNSHRPFIKVVVFLKKANLFFLSGTIGVTPFLAPKVVPNTFFGTVWKTFLESVNVFQYLDFPRLDSEDGSEKTVFLNLTR